MTLETRHNVVEMKSGDVPVLVLVVLAERLKRVDVMKILRHTATPKHLVSSRLLHGTAFTVPLLSSLLLLQV